jgi:hypothetical protein
VVALPSGIVTAAYMRELQRRFETDDEEKKPPADGQE